MNNRQSIHISIVIIASLTVLTSVSGIRAESYIESTPLPTLITPEFEPEELIVEKAGESPLDTRINKPVHYAKTGYIKKNPSSLIAQSEEEILKSSVAGTLSQGGSALIKQNIATTDIDRDHRTKNTIYVVQPGDTVTSIAHDFDISINTILWENNLTSYSIIRPGKELVILPSTGLTHTVKKNDSIQKLAETYQVEPESILESNKLLADATLQIGAGVFIPNGLKPKPTASVRYSSPTTNTNNNFVAAPRGGNYIWPAKSYHITQYYTWRHFGLDVGGSTGSPIYASADGEVITSSQGKWNGGYGNQVVVDHGNGVQTRYAHNSYNLVGVGEKITQGQPIAVMGSTGRSTGPHLHFEIMINGRRVNPLNYLQR